MQPGGEKDTVQIECVNITNLAYNWHALTKRVADINFIQEHNLGAKNLKKTKEHLEKAGWTLMCGPCDSNTKKPNARVGVIVRKGAGVTVTEGKIWTEDYQIAYDHGRAAKYHIDSNLHTYCRDMLPRRI